MKARFRRWLARLLERVGLYEPNPPAAWLEPSRLDREDGAVTTREAEIDAVARLLNGDDRADRSVAWLLATQIVDRLKPQITTVEQLEALPSRSMLVDCDGEPAVKVKRLTVIDDAGMGMAWTVEEFAEVCLPATVVWQPAQPEADR